MGEFKHKHSLGQNFLKDKNVLTKIIDLVDVKENDLIIEIGPGMGALTKYLKLFHANLLCFEIDTRVKEYLEKYIDDKTTIVYEDFLKVDINSYLEKYDYNNLYIIANIPYYITTPIIEKVIDSNINVKEMVYMVQNELADRFSAQHGTSNYCYMTVLLNYYFAVTKCFVVNRKCFDPVPKVDSAIIKFVKKDIINDCNKDILFKLVRDSFAMKRKNLRNNLRNYNLDIVEDVLKKYNLSLQDRAENVSLECFIEISNNLSK